MALAAVLLFYSGTRAPTGEGPVRTVEIRIVASILEKYGSGETLSKLPSKKTWCERRENPCREERGNPNLTRDHRMYFNSGVSVKGGRSAASRKPQFGFVLPLHPVILSAECYSLANDIQVEGPAFNLGLAIATQGILTEQGRWCENARPGLLRGGTARSPLTPKLLRRAKQYLRSGK